MYTETPDTQPAAPSPELVGESATMVRVKDQISRFANAEAPVLISGENGTGKQQVARALHAQSGRRRGPFVTLDCSVLPQGAIENELFGPRFESADGGTLLLAEVGELPAAAQGRLLVALEEGRFDVRVISSTRRAMKDLVAEGKVREDLAFRLKLLEIEVPALRDRPGDIPLLAQAFLEKLDQAPPRFSAEALQALEQHPFPGNVRELENAVRHAASLATGQPEIGIGQLPPDIAESPMGTNSTEALRPLAEAVGEFEKKYLSHALRLMGGRKSATAERLGISRKNLWEKLRKHGL